MAGGDGGGADSGGYGEGYGDDGWGDIGNAWGQGYGQEGPGEEGEEGGYDGGGYSGVAEGVAAGQAVAGGWLGDAIAAQGLSNQGFTGWDSVATGGSFGDIGGMGGIGDLGSIAAGAYGLGEAVGGFTGSPGDVGGFSSGGFDGSGIGGTAAGGVEGGAAAAAAAIGGTGWGFGQATTGMDTTAAANAVANYASHFGLSQETTTAVAQALAAWGVMGVDHMTGRDIGFAIGVAQAFDQAQSRGMFSMSPEALTHAITTAMAIGTPEAAEVASRDPQAFTGWLADKSATLTGFLDADLNPIDLDLDVSDLEMYGRSPLSVSPEDMARDLLDDPMEPYERGPTEFNPMSLDRDAVESPGLMNVSLDLSREVVDPQLDPEYEVDPFEHLDMQVDLDRMVADMVDDIDLGRAINLAQSPIEDRTSIMDDPIGFMNPMAPVDRDITQSPLPGLNVDEQAVVSQNPGMFAQDLGFQEAPANFDARSALGPNNPAFQTALENQVVDEIASTLNPNQLESMITGRSNPFDTRDIQGPLARDVNAMIDQAHVDVAPFGRDPNTAVQEAFNALENTRGFTLDNPFSPRGFDQLDQQNRAYEAPTYDPRGFTTTFDDRFGFEVTDPTVNPYAPSYLNNVSPQDIITNDFEMLGRMAPEQQVDRTNQTDYNAPPGQVDTFASRFGSPSDFAPGTLAPDTPAPDTRGPGTPAPDTPAPDTRGPSVIDVPSVSTDPGISVSPDVFTDPGTGSGLLEMLIQQQGSAAVDPRILLLLQQQGPAVDEYGRPLA